MPRSTAPATQVFPDAASACAALAGEIAALIHRRAAAGRKAGLGLATGSSPLPLYRELRRLHEEEGLSFRNVVTFNLDEYLGLGRRDAQSYWRFMHEHLFDHLDLQPENIHLPDGTVPAESLERHCAEYEQAIHESGGIDLQVLGIGTTGHIGFNEPGAARDSRTHVVELDDRTRRDNARYFGNLDAVPRRAITMGCGTILDARHIALLAWGAPKASMVREALHGPVTPDLPASFLQDHPDATFYLDEQAASLLP